MKAKIGTASAEQGTKSYGFLKVSTTPSGSPLGLPLFIVNGAQKGPLLVVDSAVHGREISGTIALMRLGQMFDPKKLKGTLVGVPVVNVPAFDHAAGQCEFVGKHLGPYDSLDMNRLFPGRNNRYVTERIAFAYFTDIVSKADYYINFHMAAPLNPIMACVIRSSGEPGLDKKCLEMAENFGLEVIWRLSAGDPKGTVIEQAVEKGIPAICPEIGAITDWFERGEYYINTALKGITNVMKSLGMIKGKPELPKSQRVIENHVWLFNRCGGLWIPKVNPRDKVAKRMLLGTIVDLLTGKEIERIESPMDGVICSMYVWPIIPPGSWPAVIHLGKIANVIEH